MQNVSWDDWNSTMETLCQQAYETWASSPTAASYGVTIPSWNDFLANPVFRVDAAPAIEFSAQIQGGTPFATPSGKIEFYQPYFETFDLTKIQDNYTGPSTGRGYYPLAIYQIPDEGFNNPGTSKYPLLLRDTHNRHRGHGFQEQNPYLRGDLYRHSVWMNPADAKARGIVDNDTVQVFDDVGTIQLPAYVTSRVTPGVVYMWDGAWYIPNASGLDTNGNANTLSTGNLNCQSQQPNNDLVDVKKV